MIRLLHGRSALSGKDYTVNATPLMGREVLRVDSNTRIMLNEQLLWLHSPTC